MSELRKKEKIVKNYQKIRILKLNLIDISPK